MRKILYCGDSGLSSAAGYLAGVMTHHKLPFDYVASGAPLGPKLQVGRAGAYGLYVFSDYAAGDIRAAEAKAILEAVRGGAGLLLVGGWATYHGLGGHWERSPLADALPVHISSTDDRVNSYVPVVIQPVSDHPILKGLPFDEPSCVGGYNRCRAKAGAQTVLVGTHLALRSARGRGGKPGKITTRPGQTNPLLVVGQFGAGRTAAFASDVAPHWVGPLVDWGKRRVRARARGSHSVEVGEWYAEFFARLLRWTSGKNLE